MTSDRELLILSILNQALIMIVLSAMVQPISPELGVVLNDQAERMHKVITVDNEDDIK